MFVKANEKNVAVLLNKIWVQFEMFYAKFPDGLPYMVSLAGFVYYHCKIAEYYADRLQIENSESFARGLLRTFKQALENHPSLSKPELEFEVSDRIEISADWKNVSVQLGDYLFDRTIEIKQGCSAPDVLMAVHNFHMYCVLYIESSQDWNNAGVLQYREERYALFEWELLKRMSDGKHWTQRVL